MRSPPIEKHTQAYVDPTSRYNNNTQLVHFQQSAKGSLGFCGTSRSIRGLTDGHQAAVLQAYALSAELETSHQAACKKRACYCELSFLTVECLAVLHTRQNTFRTQTRIERRGRVRLIGEGQGSRGRARAPPCARRCSPRSLCQVLVERTWVRAARTGGGLRTAHLQ